MKNTLSIIIPCYNEEEIIQKSHVRVENAIRKCNVSSYEIVYINDGSEDNSLSILENIAQQNKNVKIINFSRNFGHQPAVSAGIHFCKGDVAIIIDADMQDPPELFPELLKKYQNENCNGIYCVRKKRKGETFFKKITAKLFYRIMKKHTSIPLDTGDFRLIDRTIITEFKKLKEKNKFIRGLIFWLGFKQVPFYYVREEREAGKTKYPLKKMLSFAFTGLTYFSNKPLYFALKSGVSIIFIAIILGILALFTNSLQLFKNPIIIITLLILGGLNLVAMGIIGVYIANIFEELKGRPEYIIESKINF